MAINLQPLAIFQKGSNPAESWRKWKADFENYKLALKYHNEEQQVQIALFLQVCGEELRRKYETFTFPPLVENQIRQLTDIFKKFDEHFEPYRNIEVASYVFWNMKQEEGQLFDEFLTTITLQAKQCNFGIAEERNIKDKIYHGIRDGALRERLLMKSGLDLEKVIAYCKTAEISHSQASGMVQLGGSATSNNSAVVEVVNRPNERGQVQMSREQSRYGRHNKGNYSRSGDSNKRNSCPWCGFAHKKGKCPAYGMKCNFCNGLNHWERVCKTKQRQFPINNVQLEDEEYSNDVVDLGEIILCNLEEKKSCAEWIEHIKINGNRVSFKLDTGAQVNILPKAIIESWIIKPIISATRVKICTYTGQTIPVLGKCTLGCVSKGKSKNLEFIIMEGSKKPLLGLQGCVELQLIKRVNSEKKELDDVGVSKSSGETLEGIIKEYQDVFEGTGCLPGQYHITLKQNAVPYISSPRLIPQSIKEAVKSELHSMEEQGIIVKVKEPTDWVSNLKIVNKDNKLRLCLDPLKLNNAIKRPHYRIPTRRELVNKLAGTNLFTLFDAKKGFWQIELDKESSLLTTFITPYGRYRFLRMPFGLNCAPEAFQQEMDRIFEKEPSINPYFDDLLIGTNTYEQHCMQVRKMLEIARKTGLKLNREKLQLGVKEVKYLGHTLTSGGMKPSQDKVEAVTTFPEPTSKEELRRFLGMTTYLMQYIDGFSNYTLPLRNLLKSNSVFLWDENMKAAFDELKQKLISAPVLHYFSPELPVIISADASSYGVGAVLLQQGHPVAYASAALNETQQRYAQVEKELLAVVFGLEKFHYYAYGRDTIVETDHKPLIGLIEKPYHTASPRLQKLLMRWQKYQSTLKYVPGKKLAIADALSRAPLLNKEVETKDEEKLELCLVAKVTDVKLAKIKIATEQDEELQKVINYVLLGWPEDRTKVDPAITSYWLHRSELHYTEGLLCRGQRLVIPQEMRKEVLLQLHVGHRGVVACKNKAREAVFWPGLDQQVERTVLLCQLCQKYQNHNQKEPLYIKESVPEGPWQKLAIDFLVHRQQTYMLVVDYFSKYPELIPMGQTTAQAVIAHLYEIYSHGFPLQVMTDNGPPFNSQEFREFNKNHGIVQLTSSPLYPRSNGQVERAVQTIKRGLDKLTDWKKELPAMLLDYRSTSAGDMPSPAEALMGRKLRTFSSIANSQLRPNYKCKNIKVALQNRQQRQSIYADRKAKPLAPLLCGDDVWFWTGSQWDKGRVVKRSVYPRSYVIADTSGKIFRRNRIHLRNRIIDLTCDTQQDTQGSRYDEGTLSKRVDTDCQTKIPSELSQAEDESELTQERNDFNIKFNSPKKPEISQPATQAPSGYVTRVGREVRRPARFEE